METNHWGCAEAYRSAASGAAGITVKAPAKLNLFLDITGRRDNGYHLMNMVMQAVDLCDTVTLSLKDNGSSTLFCNGADVPMDKSNTALKAVQTFFEYTRLSNPGLHIRIEKNIPSQAGLGGASSDAAAVFIGLNALFGAKLTREELCALGARVGADVPFCIFGGTAHAEGIGEILAALPPLSPECRFVVVKPDYGVSTVEAFAKFDSLAEKPAVSAVSDMLGAVSSGDLESLGRLLCNVFEPVVFPEKTDAIKRALLSHGALGALMSGSGSSVFGLFRDIPAAKRAAVELSDFGETFLVKPLPTGAYID